jgi:hypothetical protein
MDKQETLSREAQLFEEHLEEWRQIHLGEFVLIKDGNVLGFFPSLDQAFAAGTRQFGLAPFFVKQIVPRDVVNVSLYGKRILTNTR